VDRRARPATQFTTRPAHFGRPEPYSNDAINQTTPRRSPSTAATSLRDSTTGSRTRRRTHETLHAGGGGPPSTASYSNSTTLETWFCVSPLGEARCQAGPEPIAAGSIVRVCAILQQSGDIYFYAPAGTVSAGVPPFSARGEDGPAA
jgi:hypothetical protein